MLHISFGLLSILAWNNGCIILAYMGAAQPSDIGVNYDLVFESIAHSSKICFNYILKFARAV